MLFLSLADKGKKKIESKKDIENKNPLKVVSFAMLGFCGFTMLIKYLLSFPPPPFSSQLRPLPSFLQYANFILFHW